MNTSELRKYIIEVMSENKYAICTASIAKTAGTTERSKWSDAAIKRYEDCKKDVGNDVNEEMNLGMDQEGEGGAPEENVALDNLTAAVDSLVQNLGYTIEEVLEIVEGLGESSGASVAMKDDEVVATMADIAEEQELEECGYPEPEEEEPKRYFKI